MFDFWTSEPTEEEVEEAIQQAFEDISKRKLELPALLALESHKPFANVMAQMSLGLAPFLVPLFGFDRVNNYSRVFSKRENLERLIARLDDANLAKRHSTENPT
ncbi:MAG: hypothetical protein JST35_01515 [Armatimonadetes bacterium]|jgi:hypothetical protein|nr:hypothetical protein [Armatimonadota bacterium]